MKREWKPGDVATATVKGRENVRVVAGWSKYDPQLRWCELSPRWADGDDDECWFMPNDVTDLRPLVVIDPEDREQVERLLRWWYECDYSSQALLDRIPRMQATLREFANPTPPKPEEPLGLGAVVVDHHEMTFVRCADGWVFAGDESHIPGKYRNPLAWEDLSMVSVRVLSEGIQ